MLQKGERYLNILALEDQVIDHSLINSLLPNKEYKIIYTSCISQVWDMVRGNLIDAVMLDSILPAIDPANVITKLKLLKEHNILTILTSYASFEFNTFEDIDFISSLITDSCSLNSNALFGINEIMLNALEHGKLGVSYEEKRNLILQNRWWEEIDLLMKRHVSTKSCTMEFIKQNSDITITVTDPGKGFDCSKYINIDPTRVTSPNGRGIALAKLLSFDSINYLGKGNIAKCKLSVAGK
jgi:CheY-like chemotaxis protein